MSAKLHLRLGLGRRADLERLVNERSVEMDAAQVDLLVEPPHVELPARESAQCLRDRALGANVLGAVAEHAQEVAARLVPRRGRVSLSRPAGRAELFHQPMPVHVFLLGAAEVRGHVLESAPHGERRRDRSGALPLLVVDLREPVAGDHHGRPDIALKECVVRLDRLAEHDPLAKLFRERRAREVAALVPVAFLVHLERR